MMRTKGRNAAMGDSRTSHGLANIVARRRTHERLPRAGYSFGVAWARVATTMGSGTMAVVYFPQWPGPSPNPTSRGAGNCGTRQRHGAPRAAKTFGLPMICPHVVDPFRPGGPGADVPARRREDRPGETA